MNMCFIDGCAVRTVINNSKAEVTGVCTLWELDILSTYAIRKILTVRTQSKAIAQMWPFRASVGGLEVDGKPNRFIV
jgi:hypothetical protein